MEAQIEEGSRPEPDDRRRAPWGFSGAVWGLVGGLLIAMYMPMFSLIGQMG